MANRRWFTVVVCFEAKKLGRTKLQVKVFVATSRLGHLHDGVLVDFARSRNVEHRLKYDETAVNVARIILHELERIVSMLFAHIVIHVAIATQITLRRTKQKQKIRFVIFDSAKIGVFFFVVLFSFS